MTQAIITFQYEALMDYQSNSRLVKKFLAIEIIPHPTTQPDQNLISYAHLKFSNNKRYPIQNILLEKKEKTLFSNFAFSFLKNNVLISEAFGSHG